MTRIMRDSTKLADIPTHQLDILAAYTNGRYATTPAQVKAHAPHAAVAWIDVNGSHPEADILDVEQGDATVPVAVLWAKARHVLRPGSYVPIIYCNRSTLTPLFNAMNFAGMRIVRDFRLWVATLDGTTKLPDMTGVTAVQAHGEAQTGGHYDESDVYDAAWLAPAPAPVGPFPQRTQPGDTLTKIAAARNTTVEHLAQVNADVELATLAKRYLTTNP
jgi:hypothetical protein